jgi:hypothetical protein
MLLFVFLQPAKDILLFLNFHLLLSKLFHHILLLLLNSWTWNDNHQKLKLLFVFLLLLKFSLAVFILLPVAQAPAVVASSTFQTLEVELYQTCPSIGLLGSAERF